MSLSFLVDWRVKNGGILRFPGSQEPVRSRTMGLRIGLREIGDEMSDRTEEIRAKVERHRRLGNDGDILDDFEWLLGLVGKQRTELDVMDAENTSLGFEAAQAAAGRDLYLSMVNQALTLADQWGAGLREIDTAYGKPAESSAASDLREALARGRVATP